MSRSTTHSWTMELNEALASMMLEFGWLVAGPVGLHIMVYISMLWAWRSNIHSHIKGGKSDFHPELSAWEAQSHQLDGTWFGFHTEQALIAEKRKEGKQNKTKLKKKSCVKKETAVIIQQGIRGLFSMWWVCFFSLNNVDTIVALTKDFQRAVYMDEMDNFVMPTLAIF